MSEQKLNEIFNIEDVKENVARLSLSTSVEFNPKNIKEIYKALSELIAQGQSMFDTLKALIESSAVPDPDLIESASSLMNAISSVLKEFTKIHMNYMKFEQAKEMERMKMRERRKLLKYKSKEARAMIDYKKSDGSIDITGQVKFVQEEIISRIIQSEGRQISGCVVDVMPGPAVIPAVESIVEPVQPQT
jgi:hypothetical protein